MCTRYFLSPSVPELKTIIDQVLVAPLSKQFIYRGYPIKTEGEIRPTDVVPVLAPSPKGEQRVYPMKWGYTNPYKGGKLLLNARSETASVKPTFREDWANHRCIIPACYYYEWEHRRRNDGKIETGERYMIQPEGEEITWLCGLYRIEENNTPTFVVLTKEPGPEVSRIHDRMPLILPSHLTGEWIRLGADPEKVIEEALTDMVLEKG